MPYYVIQTAVLLLGAFLVGAWLACLSRRLFGSRDGRGVAAAGTATALAGAGAGAASTGLENISRAPGRSGSIFGARESAEQAAIDNAALADDPVAAVVDPIGTIAIDPEPETSVAPTDLDAAAAHPEILQSQEVRAEPEQAAPEPEVETAPLDTGPDTGLEDGRHITSETTQAPIEEEVVHEVAATQQADQRDLRSESDTVADPHETHAEPVQEDPNTDVALSETATAGEPDTGATVLEQASESESAAPGEADASNAAPVGAIGAALAAAVASSALASEQEVSAPVEADQTTIDVPRAPVVAGPSQDLMQIRGIDAGTQVILNDAGIHRYDQLSGLTAEGVSGLDTSLGTPARISREGWIEQAAILARGGDTHYSRKKNRQPNQPETSASNGTPGGAGTIGGAAVSAATVAAVANAANEFSGDGSARESRAGREDRAEEREPREPREARGDREPREPREPRPDREPREPRETRELRSTRSSGESGASAMGQRRVVGGGNMVQSSGMDDLKRIRGVGVVIEKKLNAMGISTYQQIANWAPEDIAQVNGILDFSGRIERENWIEQASVLSAKA